MKKIVLVVSLLLALVGCSSGAKYHVGVIQLVQHDALDNATKGFVDVLKAEFGDDIDIVVDNAAGDSNTCSTMASNFVSEGVNLIMANATPALQAASNATGNIPILGTSVTEYGVALDIDNFSGTVGNNVSGTSDLAPLDKQADMILELFPQTKTVGILYCFSEANSKYQVEVVGKCLRDKGIEVKEYGFSDSNDVSSVAISACEEIDVLYIPTDNTCASNGEVISNAASNKNIPIITGEKECCLSVGGIATLSIDYYELGKTTGQMAIRVLKGEDISKMAIEYYPNPEKLIDFDKAKQFGINVPSDYGSLITK